MELASRHGSPGAHGYDPKLPDMGAIFFALGRGVPAGTKLGEVRAIDVAPTVAALLEIEPPQSSEGRPLFERASDRFEDRSEALTAADAHRHEAVALLAALQLAQDVAGEP